MNILHKIKIDLSRREQPARIDVVQGDSMSRSLEIKLYNNGVAYQVPESFTILQIAYCKPDKTCGLYDELPSGEVACTVAGNTVTAILHPQMFTAAGTVYCELRMIENADKRLTTFKWIMNISESVVNKMNSEDYYNFRAVSILSINDHTPNSQGEIYIAGEDIPAFPANIPDFEGSVDDALDRLATEVFSPDLSGWRSALGNYSDADLVGLPVINPDADQGWSPMQIEVVDDSEYEKILQVPTVNRVRDIVRDAVLSGYIDVTAEYEAALAGREVSCAKEYLWTLGVGRWHLSEHFSNGDAYHRYYLHVLEGETWNGRASKYRILVNAQDFCYIEFYHDGQYDETPFVVIDGEMGDVYSNGKLCSPTDLAFKDGKVYLAKDGIAFGEGALLPIGSGFVKSVNGQAPDEKGNVEITIPEGGTGSGTPGRDGKDGGYYTIHVKQESDDTIKMSFLASEEGMISIKEKTISLPRGATGEKGDPGTPGKDGAPGTDGYTPVKGVDYYTPDEQNEMVNAIKESVPLVKTAEQPIFVNSVDECIDTNKAYLLPDGHLYVYRTTIAKRVTPLTSEDFVACNVNTDGTINTVSSSKIRIATVDLLPLGNDLLCINCPAPYQYIVYFYSGSTYIGKTSFKFGGTLDVLSETVTSGTKEGATHCRVALRDNTDTSAILTDRLDEFMSAIAVEYVGAVEEEISEWSDTGLTYNQPSVYEERLVALETLVGGIENGTF